MTTPRRAVRQGARPLRVAILEGHDFAAWQAEYQRGERPSRVPYGLEHLQRADVELRHSDVTHREDRLGRLLRRRDSSLPYALRYRGALGQVLTSLPLLSRSDVCVSIFEHHADMYRRLRAVATQVLPPLVLVSCYLTQWLRADDPALRRQAVAIARSASAITVFSANQIAILGELAGVTPDRISLIPYGVDTSFYTPTLDEGSRPGYVLAVGKDAGRDWPTFLRAARMTPEIPYRLATDPRMVAGQPIPGNVDFLGEVGHLAYRELLRGSELVVLPTHDFAYPTGQSVLLEAMACGCPTVVSDTSAMRDYVTPATCAYPVGDATGLAAQIRSRWHDTRGRAAMATDARRIARERFSTENLWAAALPAIVGCAKPGIGHHH